MAKFKLVLASSALAALAVANVAEAQTSPQSSGDQADSAIADIVVTAQKRSEVMQDVPIAISAFNEDRLAATGVADTSTLKTLTPGLNFTSLLGASFTPNLRGIGNGGPGPGVENPVATYIDGVYIASLTGALAQLNDVEQVAVLKGPQGTLFGRNATGGVIQITTRKPSHTPTGDFHLLVGNHGTYGGDGYVSGGLSKNLAGSVSLYYNNQTDGFGKNLVTGHDVNKGESFASRAKLRWEPGQSTQITLSGDYSLVNMDQPANATVKGTRNPLGQDHAGGFWDIASEIDPHVRTEQYGTNLNIQHEFGGTVKLVSISAYRNSNTRNRTDLDSMPIFAIDGEFVLKEQQFSQELQLQSIAGAKLKWVLGAFYFWSNGKYDPFTNTVNPAPVINLLSDQSSHSIAGFGQATYEILPETHITGGIRYTSEKRDGHVATNIPPVDSRGSKTFNKFTYRLSLDHRFSPELLAYASFNTGFKSGLYDPVSAPVRLVRPETLKAYEVGFKADLFDRSVRLNMSGFYYDYSNPQFLILEGGFSQLRNADSLKTHGIDADLTWRVTRNLTLNTSFAWLDGEYGHFSSPGFRFSTPTTTFNPATQGYYDVFFADAGGNKLQLAPKYTFNLGFNYKLPVSESAGKFTLASNFYYNDGWFADPSNRLKEPHYTLFDASLLWTTPSGKLDLRLWGRNLFNTKYSQQKGFTGNADNYAAAAGRTYGVTVGAHF